MFQLLLCCLVFSTIGLATAEGETTETRRYFDPEDSCSKLGGICINHSICSAPASDPNACSKQKALGAVCCQKLPDDETQCARLGGHCIPKKHCKRNILTKARDCPETDDCCLLIN